jgi:small-conductance mechanosensitive channel
LSKLLSIAVIAVLAVGALKLFGLDKESLGLAGITAAVTATAGQSFLKQFLASMFMSLPETAIQVGDVVAVSGILGTVTKVSLVTEDEHTATKPYSARRWARPSCAGY